MKLTGQVYVTEEELPPTNNTSGKDKQGNNAGSGGGGGFVFVRQEDLFYSQLTGG